ncbi:MAG: hypothetical protein WCB99_06320 [Candidatus Cybelea sp.]
MQRKLSARNLMRCSAACIVVALAACSGGMTPSTSTGVQNGAASQAALSSIQDAADVQQQIASGNFIQACPDAGPGKMRCLTLGLRDTSVAPRSETPQGSVAGYGPSQLQAAYNFTKQAKKNAGGLVVIVDAGNDPAFVSDLQVYRKQFGLPKCDRGCVKVVNQEGKSKPLPPTITSWLGEEALDGDMVSANCPNCKIIIVEADSNNGIDLFKSEKTAAKFHPMAISNSWGGGEYKGEGPATKRFFDYPGIAVTASTGDGGYGVIYPSTAETVTAVGGTSLRTGGTGSRGWTETVWAGAGSGCSQFIKETSWQAPIEQQLGGCTNRIAADVSYDANPGTGVAVYETTPGDGEAPGWQVWGGTSVGSPAIAAIYALSGNVKGVPASLAYANPGDLFDVTSGSNGDCAPNNYLCTGEVGYDGPTGLGTPNGLGAF